MGRRLARKASASHPALAALAALALTGCSAFAPDPNALQPGQPGFVRGFVGAAASDDPRAALIARNTLSAGGSAADAAVAGGLMLSVTQPSRAALGGGGACLLFAPRRAEAEAILFLPGAREATPPGADRPAAVPMLARGLFALHARGGVRPFEELIAPAEQAARFGVEVSRALAADIAAVAGPPDGKPRKRPGGPPGPARRNSGCLAGTGLWPGINHATGLSLSAHEYGMRRPPHTAWGIHQGWLARRVSASSLAATAG